METPTDIDIYGGRNPLDMPLYSVAEASRYLHIAHSTVRYWSKGGPYSSKGKKGYFEPLIKASGQGRLSLSFLNLVELDVLQKLRKVHKVSSETVRIGLLNAKKELGTERPLLSESLYTFGRHLFTDSEGNLIKLTNIEQAVLEGILRQVLERVQRDEAKIPIKFYPTVDNAPIDKPIVFDPEVSFGKPVLNGVGIRASMIIIRLTSGETVDDVARDYGIDVDLVTSAAMYAHKSAA